MNARLEALFAKPVWDQAKIALVRKELDAVQRRHAALIRGQVREEWHGQARLQANYRCGTADQRP